MKKYLKNNQGMALPMVLIIMMILTILAAALGTYASQSLRTVKYMNAQKQAYYLARAGVEAGAFAYQNATTKTSSSFDNNDNFANGLVDFSNVDKFVSVIEDSDEKITSNKVYLVFDGDNENEGTMWEGLKFTTNASANAIGYFSIEIAGGEQETIVNDNGEEKEVLKPVVEFRSTAVCFNSSGSEVSRVSTGYMYPSTTVESETCYGADGYLSTNTADFDNSDTKTVNYTDENAFNTKTGRWWQRLKNGLLRLAFEAMKATGLIPTQEDITVYEMIGGGDLIMARPSEDVGEIKINEGVNNFYIFSTSGSLILEDTGLYADPTKGKYATIGLYGSDIVVDGDITMGVYHTNTSAYAGSVIGNILDPLTTLIDTIGNRYRLGTVMIGNGLASGGEWAEYLSYDNGGITDQNGKTITNGSRIFFNGNVNVKIYSQGSATKTYRVFSAGDVCLFNGVYEVSNQSLDGEEVATRGIDLLKYFLDAVIAEEDGFKFGDSAIKEMTQIRDLYYGDPASADGEPSYFQDGTRVLRKLNVNLGASSVSIDGKALTYKVGDRELIEYIQQPTPTGGFKINWGKPTVSVLAD